MLGPIYAQRWSRDGAVGSELRRALEWWLQVFDSGLCEKLSWSGLRPGLLHLFCDASGVDARLGAVCFDAGTWYWTTAVAPKDICASFCVRGDRQIMALELLAISMALKTFEPLLANRTVVVHCDNKGAEVRFPPWGGPGACASRVTGSGAPR